MSGRRETRKVLIDLLRGALGLPEHMSEVVSRARFCLTEQASHCCKSS